MSTLLDIAGKLVIIYGGIPVFVAGVLGGLLNTIVFLSLRTFRQNSCAFYLTVMSTVNIGQLFFGLFSRILFALSGFDGTETSLFYCKFRPYIFQTCIGVSMTCLCLVTIDQYCATCFRPCFQQLCKIKLAQRLTIPCVIIWSLHGIPYLVFYNHVVSPITNKLTCISTSSIFVDYRTYVIVLVLIGYLPVAITALFGLMAYLNVQRTAYRTVPLVRRELDKQLTVMVLVQVVANIFSISPYTTVFAITINKNLTNDPIVQAKLQFAITVTLVMTYIYFASPFYIYICASERFRRQLIYVLFTIHLKRRIRPEMSISQVIPET